MVSTLLENILVKTDTLLERILGQPQNREIISFSHYLSDPRKILLIPGENLADFALSLDFLDPLLKKFPQAELFLLIRPDQAPLLGNLKRVQTIYCRYRSPYSFNVVFHRTVALLRQENFDWAVNLTCSGRPEALLTYNSGAKIRTGLALNDNEKYYNLVVKNISSQVGFTGRFAALFRALHVDGPIKTGQPVFKPNDAEMRWAHQFLRHRKSSRGERKFIGLFPEWLPGDKNLERLLHNFVAELVKEFDPLQLLIAQNLAPAEELRKWTEVSAYVHGFDDLRQTLAFLAGCDRVITNSVGAACLLSRLGSRVCLIGADEEQLSRLEAEELEKIQIPKSDQEKFPLKQAINFTH